MIARYLPDIAFMIMAGIIAFALAGVPKDKKAPVPASSPKSSSVKTSLEVKSAETGQKSDGTAIGARNIFASSGSYKGNSHIPVPDNPYILIGIVREGSGMKAIFREYTGMVTKAAAGHRMMDGFRVTAVSSRHVLLKKGNEKKALYVYGASIQPASGQSDMKNHLNRELLLVGILEGAEKRAVFKDQAGNMAILKVRQSLPDGFVVTRIDAHSVGLKKGKNKKDLSLYKQAFPKPPIQTVQAPAKDKEHPPTNPGRRRPSPPNNKVGETEQGGVK